jgi:hypothetical protein
VLTEEEPDENGALRKSVTAFPANGHICTDATNCVKTANHETGLNFVNSYFQGVHTREINPLLAAFSDEA